MVEARRSVIRFLRLPEAGDLPLPAYASAEAAGFDLRAAIPAGEDVVLAPGGRALLPIGFAVALPAGYELQIRPRSGLAVKHGVTVLNSPGTIDADYRGPLAVALINHGSEPFVVRRGDRIAQAVPGLAPQLDLREVAELDETTRGSGGFGSTGLA